MCGEKLIAVSPQTSTLGSPPRVRGKDARLSDVPDFAGITPACAGKGEAMEIATKQYGITPACAGKRIGHTDISMTR